MILTARASYDLSSSQYGVLFVPQVSTAIAASLAGAGLLWPGLTRRASEKTVYLADLLADLASMVLLIASWLVVRQYAAAFALLLVATADRPGHGPRAGTRRGVHRPRVLVGLPVLAACLLASLIAVSLRLPLDPGASGA